MQEYITSYSIANEIRMIRSAFSGSFVIVEGDIDKKVYQNFIDPTACKIKCIEFKNDSNKQRVIEIIEILNADKNFAGALALIDADFDNFEKTKKIIENLFRTDFHDLECLIFVSPALEKVLTEFGSDVKITKFGKDVREVLFGIAGLSYKT